MKKEVRKCESKIRNKITGTFNGRKKFLDSEGIGTILRYTEKDGQELKLLNPLEIMLLTWSRI